jgi:hypothetical protein
VILKEAFAVLFSIACAKDASSIVAHLEFLGGSNLWNVSFFARATHD